MNALTAIESLKTAKMYEEIRLGTPIVWDRDHTRLRGRDIICQVLWHQMVEEKSNNEYKITEIANMSKKLCKAAFNYYVHDALRRTGINDFADDYDFSENDRDVPSTIAMNWSNRLRSAVLHNIESINRALKVRGVEIRGEINPNRTVDPNIMHYSMYFLQKRKTPDENVDENAMQEEKPDTLDEPLYKKQKCLEHDIKDESQPYLDNLTTLKKVEREIAEAEALITKKKRDAELLREAIKKDEESVKLLVQARELLEQAKKLREANLLKL
ncbi:unnamed protein product [Sphagnum balticum]